MTPTVFGELNRRSFLRGAAAGSALLASASLSPLAAQTGMAAAGPVPPGLGSFIVRYMEAMHAPGMTLALVPAKGPAMSAAFGMSDVAGKVPVTTEMLFLIGSISKSFCALALLQMRDEGKLDLHRPVLDYLPWLPLEQPLAPVTVHHLLTHTGGLVHNYPLFAADPGARIPQTFKPGDRFEYSNLGFQILGYLAAALDGKTYPSVLQTRVLDRLGMRATQPAIWPGNWAAQAQSYQFFRGDLANVPASRLRVAVGESLSSAAGCVAAPPADMALYLKMLLAHGATPQGRLVSKESFELFATPYIKAPEFGPTLSYGHGVAVDAIDGHKVLMHTGGMESFASAFHADLESGVAAFASINAMQGYRPVPITRYAVVTLRAEAESKPLPPAPALPDPQEIDNAANYAGRYTGDKGTAEVIADGKHLTLVADGVRAPLAQSGQDTFVALDDRVRSYTWAFGRNDASKVVDELIYGPHWYPGARYAGPKSFEEPMRWKPFVGRYVTNAELSEVYLLKGKLMADGVTLDELSPGVFRYADMPDSPHRVRSLHVVNGSAQVLLFDGEAGYRLEVS